MLLVEYEFEELLVVNSLHFQTTRSPVIFEKQCEVRLREVPFACTVESLEQHDRVEVGLTGERVFGFNQLLLIGDQTEKQLTQVKLSAHLF